MFTVRVLSSECPVVMYEMRLSASYIGKAGITLCPRERWHKQPDIWGQGRRCYGSDIRTDSSELGISTTGLFFFH